MKENHPENNSSKSSLEPVNNEIEIDNEDISPDEIDILEKLIERKLHEILEDDFGVRVKHQEVFFSGPIPPPEILAQYEKIHPDIIPTITKMATSDLQHLHELQHKKIDYEFTLAKKGALYGLIIGVLVIVCGTIIILSGHETTGSIFTGVGLTSLIGTFIYDVKMKRQTTDKKQDESEE